MAIQGGIISRRVDRTKFKWGEQWNPITGYAASNPTTETFSKSSSTVLDIGAGILYYDASPDKLVHAFGGVSVYHLNKPKDPIISIENTDLNIIPMRYSVHGGVSVAVSEVFSFVPHVLYMRQGTASETMAGMYGQLNVNEETNFMLGAYYRVNDAMAPFVGIDYKNFVVGLSYDVNASKLGSMTRNVNSIELTVSYVKRNGSRSIIDFIRCSRL
jgi:type IX secretion system PorP/SprF family membrane protein